MFKVIDEVCKPQRGTKYSAYIDLFAREDITINAGASTIIPLGIKIDLKKLKANYTDYGFDRFMKSHYMEVALRSSLAVKGLIIANGKGVIDLDYTKEIGLIVHNPIKMSTNQGIPDRYLLHPFEIKKGDKVAQCTLKEHKGYLMGYESEVLRDGGFGSTGN